MLSFKISPTQRRDSLIREALIFHVKSSYHVQVVPFGKMVVKPYMLSHEHKTRLRSKCAFDKDEL